MEGATVTVMETLTKAVGDVFTLMGTCFTQITSARSRPVYCRFAYRCWLPCICKASPCLLNGGILPRGEWV